MNEENQSFKLPARYERFCVEFVKLRVGERAALAAGFKPGNAYRQATRLLCSLDILERIKELESLSINPVIE